MEYRSGLIAAGVLEKKTARDHAFSLTRDDVQNLGMICGGACDAFFHYLSPTDRKIIELCRRAEAAFQKGSDLWLLTDVVGNDMSLYSPSEGFWGIEIPQGLTPSRHPERTGRGCVKRSETKFRGLPIRWAGSWAGKKKPRCRPWS